MKKLAILAITLVLVACGDAKAPAGNDGTVVKEGDEWAADTPQEGDVEVKLPDTPVKIEQAPLADFAGEASPEDTAKPTE